MKMINNWWERFLSVKMTKRIICQKCGTLFPSTLPIFLEVCLVFSILNIFKHQLTSDCFYNDDIAGTNANVKLQLYGDKGKSDTMSLDSSKNNFERGSIDKFSHVGVDLGKLLKVNHFY